jgi:hypothetical protein
MIKSLWKILPYFILVRWLKSRSDADYATLVITSFGSDKRERKGKIKIFDNGEYLFIEEVSELLQKRSSIARDLRTIDDALSKYGV